MERQYEKLIVWKEAHVLCLRIYKYTMNYPKEERYGLISQMRRSSSSVPTNIAEGNGRRSFKEKIHFLDISTGSLEELHYQCRLSKDLNFISLEQFEDINDIVHRVGYLLQQTRRSLK